MLGVLQEQLGGLVMSAQRKPGEECALRPDPSAWKTTVRTVVREKGCPRVPHKGGAWSDSAGLDCSKVNFDLACSVISIRSMCPPLACPPVGLAPIHPRALQ